MSQPSGVDLIVTLIEAIIADNRADNLGDDCAVPYWLLNGLIASSRERGEALKKMQARYEGGQKAMSADALQQALYDAVKP